MLIKQVKLFNFRQYKGENTISFNTNEDQNIIVVSGKNGNGKTNFLISLVWCLYGKDTDRVDDFFKDYFKKQGGYQKYIANSLNNVAKAEGVSEFYVSVIFTDLHISELPCSEIKITRKFNTDKSDPEDLEILIDGQASELIREYNSEHFIRDFLIPLEAAKFFFFDAEKIVSLAEATDLEERKALSKAYSEVLGIKKYDDLKKSLLDLQNEFKQESATAKDREKLIRYNSEVVIAEYNIFTKERDIQIKRELIVELRFEVSQIQERLIKEGNTISVEELQKLQKKEVEIRQSLDEAKEKLKDLLELAPFAIAGDWMLQIAEQSEQEANLKTIQFKDEQIDTKTEEILLNIDESRMKKTLVVPQHIQDFYNGQIRLLIRQYFFDDESTPQDEIKTLHDFNDGERRKFNELLFSLKNSYKDQFKSLTRDYNNLKYEGDTISRKLRNAESNAEDTLVQSFRKKKDALELEIRDNESLIETFQREIGAEQNARTNLKGEISELTKKVDIADRYREKDELAKRLTSELSEFIASYKARKKKSLQDKILKGLSTLMHTLKVKTVNVDMIGEDIDIQLYNERKEIIPKESLSKGQQQLYATALLKALVEESNINFPVFIDSPMQKFDLEHAKNIIQYFYPNVSEQVVIFPLLGKELTEKEYGQLRKHVSQCYLIHKTGDTSQFLSIPENKLFETYYSLYPND